MPNSRSLVRALLAIGCFWGCVGCGGGRKPDSVELGELLPTDPELSYVVVSFDALRSDALGAYGSTSGASPNMDAFAAESLVFERAYTAGHSTPSSFAAAFTGQYPAKVLLGWKLEAAVTLAETFSAAGFRTAGFFNSRQLDAERNFGRGFDRYEVVFIDDEDEFLDLPLEWLCSAVHPAPSSTMRSAESPKPRTWTRRRSNS